jgi:ribA/ribD-fused uncharacterized protein
MSAIEFWSTRGDFGFMSNFSKHPIVVDGVVYPTTEHYYQCAKMRLTKDRNAVLALASPKEAADYARDPNHRMIDGWDNVKDMVMYSAIKTKVFQHPDLAEKLLATADMEIIEASPIDSYWGWGPNKDGRNQLGKTWMKVRAELRAEKDSNHA